MRSLNALGRKTPLSRRAQIFTSDIVLATSIFLVILGLFVYLWAGLVGDIVGMETEYEMSWLATASSEKLVRTAGEPYNWTDNPDISNLTIIGLADTETLLNSTRVLDRIVDPDKLMRFIEFSKDDYVVMRGRMFGLGRYNYYAELSCLDDANMECFQNLESRTLDNVNVTCQNDEIFYSRNHTLWADPDLGASWHFEEERGNSAADTSGNHQTGTIYGALKASFVMGSSTSSYVYEDLTSVPDYIIQTNDYLEYDLYWTLPDDDVAVDYTTSDGSTLRSSSATDQYSRPANSATDLDSFALGQWYHRIIALPSEHEGKTIKYYDIACESNSDGPRTAYLDNIVITNGGLVRKTIYNSSSFSHALHMQKDGILSSLSNDASPTAWNSTGRFGTALSLDGENDRMEIPDNPALDQTDRFTVSLWFKTGDLSGDQWILSKEPTDHDGYGLYLSGSNVRFIVNMRNISGEYQWGAGAAMELQPDTWYHVSGVFSPDPLGSLTPAIYLIHMNGSMSGNTAGYYEDHYDYPFAPTGSDSNTSALIVGGSANNHYGLANFNGLIDEVKIWSRALTQAEIEAEFSHNRRVCMIGQNASLRDVDYMTYDTKSFTFNADRNTTHSDLQTDLLDPTAKIKVVVYLPGGNF